MKKLKEKIIVVTGGSGLLGKEFLRQIKSEGGVGINLDINHETNLEKLNIHCDVTDNNSIKNSIDIIIKKFGRIDGLVNNAYPRTKDWNRKFEEISIDSWKKNIDYQLNSHFLLTQLVSKNMIANKNGSIINIASIYGLVGPDFNLYSNLKMTNPAAYSAIKGGLINFTRYLSSYLGKFNIRVNSISPGGIFDNQDQSFIDRYENKVPLGRMGLPKDIAPGLIFLLSDDSSYITGHNLIIDGGWTAI